jgi:hypothetical protein
MKQDRVQNKSINALGAVFLLLMTGLALSAQNPLQISATAMGTNELIGRHISVEVRISAYSTAEDRQALVGAYVEKGSEGLANALQKMPSKGRITITGTVGYDLKYVREFKMSDGTRKIRFITDRPIRSGEVWSSPRSMDYMLARGEIVLGKGKVKSIGTLLPAALFKLNKEREIEIEAFVDSWDLTNIRVR